VRRILSILLLVEEFPPPPPSISKGKCERDYVYGSFRNHLKCLKSPLTHTRQRVAGYPLFPGENEVEQLACMMEVLGVPPNAVLENATRKKMFFGKHMFSCNNY
jgi:hypothetical protein